MGYGYSEDAVDWAADWLVLTTEDEPWLAGRDSTALCLDFFWGGSPLAAIATALAEGLCRQFECFSGISSMQKNSEKKNAKYYRKQYFESENKKINTTSYGKTLKKWQGKPVRQRVDDAASFLLCIKLDTHS